MATETTTAPDPDDEGVVIEFDPGQFNRAERRGLQDRFGRHFEELLEFVDDGWFRRPIRVQQADGSYRAERLPVPPPIEVDGQKFYADDVLLAMLGVQLRKADPAADVSVLDEMGSAELDAAIRRGRAGKGGGTPPAS